MIVARDASLASRLRAAHAALPCEPRSGVLRDVLKLLAMRAFLHPSRYWLPAGLPFLELGESAFQPDFPVHRMHPARAALLWGWRHRLAEANARRRAAAALILAGLPPSVRPVPSAPGSAPTYLRLPVLAASARVKAALCRREDARALGISPLYPAAVTRIPALARDLRGYDTPGAAVAAGCLVTLPVHPLLRPDDCRRICAFLGRVAGTAPGARVVPDAGAAAPAPSDTLSPAA
jgi:hypothetical protein